MMAAMKAKQYSPLHVPDSTGHLFSFVHTSTNAKKKKKLAGLAEIGHDSHEKTLWSVCKEYRYKNSAMFRTI